MLIQSMRKKYLINRLSNSFIKNKIIQFWKIKKKYLQKIMTKATEGRSLYQKVNKNKEKRWIL